MNTRLRRSPRVSVVMAVRNGEAFLEQAIDSVLRQTFDDLELIVVDDGSDDGTPALLAAHAQRDPRVLVHRQAQAGYIRALNEGCRHARADLIARMDADDLAEPARIERQVRFLEHRPEVAVVGGAMLLITAAGRPFYIAAFPESPSAVREAFASRNPVAHPTAMMRRSAFESVGGYRETFVHAEDYDLWLRIASTAEIANVPDLLGRYRIHPSNASHNNLRQQAVSMVLARSSAAGPDAPLPTTVIADVLDEAEVAEAVLDLALWWGSIGARAGRPYRGLARQAYKAARHAAQATRDPRGSAARVREEQARVQAELGRGAARRRARALRRRALRN